jgi:hypothetical protein
MHDNARAVRGTVAGYPYRDSGLVQYLFYDIYLPISQ